MEIEVSTCNTDLFWMEPQVKEQRDENNLKKQ